MNKIALTLALAFAPLALFWWGMAGMSCGEWWHREALWIASLIWILDSGMAHKSGLNLRKWIGGE